MSDPALDKIMSKYSTEQPCGCIDRAGYTLVCDAHVEAMDSSPEERIAMITKWLQALHGFRLEESRMKR